MTADVLGGTEVRAPASLSPSRAADFLTCPLLYRFRVIDRLPERPSPAATRGTVVHSVLERLFDLPAVERTLQQARDLVVPEWERLLEAEPELAELFPLEPAADADPADADAGSGRLDQAAWLQSARDLLDAYFELEDPTRLEPAERELFVECEVHVRATDSRRSPCRSSARDDRRRPSAGAAGTGGTSSPRAPRAAPA